MILPPSKFFNPFPSFNPLFFPCPAFYQAANAIHFSEYQQNYSKTFDSLKVKYKRSIAFSISLEEVSKCSIFLYNYAALNPIEKPLNLQGNELDELQKKKIYCFLCTLVFYEVDFKKNHETFNSEEWEAFSETSRFLSKDDVFCIKDEIFKRLSVNCIWKKQEDERLFSLVKIFQNNDRNKIPWKAVVSLYNNQNLNGAEKRSTAQCRERWRNYLRLEFKKGKWSKAEDIKIVEFVIENGTKWSKLARTFNDRTEHNTKNRFFSILSKFTETPIRKIKKVKSFKNKEILKVIVKKLRAKQGEEEEA